MSANLFQLKLQEIEKKLRIKKEQEKIIENRQNEQILKSLNLTKLFQDEKKRNELFELMNNANDSKDIFKTAKKSAELYNKTFDSLDNGNFKPLATKLFDILEDKIKDKVKDNLQDKAKDSFDNLFGERLENAKQKGVKANYENIKDILENTLEKPIKKEKDLNDDLQKDKQTYQENSKKRSFERLRAR